MPVPSIAGILHLDNSATKRIMNLARSRQRVPGSTYSERHDLEKTIVMQQPPKKERITRGSQARLFIRLHT